MKFDTGTSITRTRQRSAVFEILQAVLISYNNGIARENLNVCERDLQEHEENYIIRIFVTQTLNCYSRQMRKNGIDGAWTKDGAEEKYLKMFCWEI